MGYRIGVDLDGVCADFDRQWRTKYQEWFGGEALAFTGSWDAFLEQTHFENEAEFWAWVNEVPNFWESMPAVPGAFGAILTLARQGNEVVFITSRHQQTRQATETWLKRFWPLSLRRPQIHHTNKSQKGAIECQLYVDDNPAVLEALRGKPCVLIFDQPWNTEVKSGRGLHRVRGWAELTKFVGRLGADEPNEDSDVIPESAEVVKAGK